MTVKSINSIITPSFVRRFQGLASTGNSNPLSGASKVAISDGLRIGAQTYGSAIQNLNALIGITNIASSTLEKLLEITDTLIRVTDTATKSGIGQETRNRLNSQFKDLADKFREIVEEAKIGDVEILTEEGLTELFSRFGLDSDSAQSVARVFANFVIPLTESDGSYASERVKGKRPAEIPLSAYTINPSDNNYLLTKITDSNLSGNAFISTDKSVFADDLYGSGGASVATQVDISGAVKIPTTSSIEQTLLSMNETTGSYIIESSEDLTGGNVGNRSQLFLYNSSGNMVGQITSNFDPTMQYKSADISQDEGRIAYSAEIGAGTFSFGYVDYGVGTTVIPYAGVDTPSSDTKIAISNDGATIAISTAGGEYIIRDVVGATDFVSAGSAESEVKFIDDNTLGFLTESAGDYFLSKVDIDGTNEVALFNLGTTLPDLSILQADSTYSTKAGLVTRIGADLRIFEIDPASAYAVTEYDGSGDLPDYNVSLAGTIDSVSLAFSRTSPGYFDIGIKGAITSYNGDADTELYRINFNQQSLPGRRISVSIEDPLNVLDSTISNRPNAFRTLDDLKALRSLLTDNIEALKGVTRLVDDNIALVRATGFAFLDLSNSLRGSEDAEQVANLLRAEIRKNARQAILAQAENLQSITIAALAFSDD